MPDVRSPRYPTYSSVSEPPALPVKTEPNVNAHTPLPSAAPLSVALAALFGLICVHLPADYWYRVGATGLA
jgi:hypothetical protein